MSTPKQPSWDSEDEWAQGEHNVAPQQQRPPQQPDWLVLHDMDHQTRSACPLCQQDQAQIIRDWFVGPAATQLLAAVLPEVGLLYGWDYEAEIKHELFERYTEDEAYRRLAAALASAAAAHLNRPAAGESAGDEDDVPLMPAHDHDEDPA
jgi:hypothetical protein